MKFSTAKPASKKTDLLLSSRINMTRLSASNTLVIDEPKPFQSASAVSRKLVAVKYHAWGLARNEVFVFIA
jgi:hypothetical protein